MFMLRCLLSVCLCVQPDPVQASGVWGLHLPNVVQWHWMDSLSGSNHLHLDHCYYKNS